MLRLGIKAHHKDLQLAVTYSPFIEMHENVGDLDGKAFEKQVQLLSQYEAQGIIKRLSIHSPMNLVNGESANTAGHESQKEEVIKCIKLAGTFPKFKVPIVIHAWGSKTLSREEAAEKCAEIAETQFKGSNALAAFENITERINFDDGIYPFHGLKDFEMLTSKSKRVFITLDVCHFFTNELSYKDLDDFVSSYDNRIANVHISDVTPGDWGSQGQQIFEGKLDFDKIFDILKKIKTDFHIIPEIKDGHTENYKDFAIAFERLRRYFPKEKQD